MIGSPSPRNAYRPRIYDCIKVKNRKPPGYSRVLDKF